MPGAPARDAAPDPSAPSDAAVSSIEDRLGALRFDAYPEPSVPEGNPLSSEKAVLGKILFWDEQLSHDDSVACGTCHRPAAGGADPRPAQPGFVGHPGADGVRGTADDPRGSPGVRRCERTEDGGRRLVGDPIFGAEPRVTRRRSMSFIDALLWQELFWDGRAQTAFVDPLEPTQVLLASGAALESQAVQPIQNADEMACEGFRWEDLTAKLQAAAPLAKARALPHDVSDALESAASYPALFRAAFGTSEITPARIAFALASYERTLRSDQTPWDLWNAGDASALGESARRGLLLFVTEAGCSCCHAPPLFGASAYGNDGFSAAVWDEGRFEVTGEPRDRGAFRVPSLRNVGLRESAGLLHDGVGAGRDLETLVHRYGEDPEVPAFVGLCVRRPAKLTEEQTRALLELLRQGLTDPRVRGEQPPFDRPKLSSE